METQIPVNRNLCSFDTLVSAAMKLKVNDFKKSDHSYYAYKSYEIAADKDMFRTSSNASKLLSIKDDFEIHNNVTCEDNCIKYGGSTLIKSNPKNKFTVLNTEMNNCKVASNEGTVQTRMDHNYVTKSTLADNYTSCLPKTDKISKKKLDSVYIDKDIGLDHSYASFDNIYNKRAKAQSSTKVNSQETTWKTKSTGSSLPELNSVAVEEMLNKYSDSSPVYCIIESLNTTSCSSSTSQYNKVKDSVNLKGNNSLNLIFHPKSDFRNDHTYARYISSHNSEVVGRQRCESDSCMNLYDHSYGKSSTELDSSSSSTSETSQSRPHSRKIPESSKSFHTKSRQRDHSYFGSL